MTGGRRASLASGKEESMESTNVRQRKRDPGGASLSGKHPGELSHRSDRGRETGERGASW